MEGVSAEIVAALNKEGGKIDYKTRARLFRQAIAEIDWSVGQILDTLKANGLDENTFVVFTSDNGPPKSTLFASAGPLRGNKGTTFEGGMREPTVVRWPGKIPAGKSNDELMTAMDLLPTFAKLSGAAIPTDRVIDGKDIWPTLIGEAQTPHEAFFYHRGNQLQAVRSGKWKLHSNKQGQPTQLYDLESDIGEKKNVLRDTPEVAQKLGRLLKAFAKDIADNSRPAAFVDDPKPLSMETATSATNYQAITHSFLACGRKTYIMGVDGKPSWTYPAASRDGYVLSDGTIILTLSKSQRYRGGAVVSIAPGGKETLLWKGTQSEVNSAHPTSDGAFVITEAGANPRLLEISTAGKVLVEFPLACQKENHHMQTRMARKLPDGTYLAPHLLNFAVYNYARDGKILAKLDTTVPGDEERKVHTWPFTAIRHGDGHTLVCCTNGNRVVDFDADGKICWTLTNDDLPGNWLQDPCGGQVLPNGNVVIASYAAGRADRHAPKLFEVTRDKTVVWKYADGQKVGIHHFQIITTNGRKLRGPALK